MFVASKLANCDPLPNFLFPGVEAQLRDFAMADPFMMQTMLMGGYSSYIYTSSFSAANDNNPSYIRAANDNNPFAAIQTNFQSNWSLYPH